MSTMPSPESFSPELRALVSLFGKTTSADLGAIEPRRFITLARRHKLGPLVLRKLAEHGIHHSVIQTRLQKGLDDAKPRALRTNLEIGLLADLAQKAGIPLIIAKGPVLSKTLYGRADLKTSADLDWFTLPETMPQLTTLLQQQGYAHPYAALKMSPRKLQALYEAQHDIPFTHPARGIPNEVHWSFGTNQQGISPRLYQQSISRAQTLRWGEHTISVFTNEDLFLYLCFHGAKHFWARLNWLVDVNEMITNQAALNLNLPAVQAAAQEYQLTHCLTQTYDLCHSLFGTPLPQATPQPSKHRAWLTQKALEEIASDSPETQTTRRVRYFSHLLYDQRLSSSWKSSARFLWQQRYKTEDLLLLDLPDKLFFLYTLLRPYFWLRKKLAKK